MALLMIRTVCLLVYAALEYRIRTALKDHGLTFPDPKGNPTQTPTARWVFHYFVGIHLLFIPQQWPIVINVTEEHQHLLQLLGRSVCMVLQMNIHQTSEPRCGMSVDQLVMSIAIPRIAVSVHRYDSR